MDEKKKNKIIYAVVISAAVLLILFNALSFFGASIFLPGREIARVTGRDPETNRDSTIDLSKGTVFLHIWATWCGACVAEMPEINRIAAKHKFYGVLKPVFKHDVYSKAAPKFKNVIASEDFFKDLYISVLPTTLLIENGIIKDVHTGPMTLDFADKWVNSL